MFVLMIKMLVAVILTAIPFIFQGFVKPKQTINGRWKNFYSFMAPWGAKLKEMVKQVRKLQ